MKTQLKMVIVVLGMAALVGACNSAEQADQSPLLNDNAGLIPASSSDEINKAMRNIVTQNMVTQFDALKGQCKSKYNYAMPTLPTSTGDAASATEFSKTNTQEAAVDEADIVKTDGKYVYVLANGMLKIIKSWPAEEMKSVGEVEIAGIASRMFLHKTTAIVLSSVSPFVENQPASSTKSMVVSSCVSASYNTKVTWVDIADANTPKILRTAEYVGQLISERNIGGLIYAVTSSFVNTNIDDAEYTAYVPYQEWPECDESKKPVDADLWIAKIEGIKSKNKDIINKYDFSTKFPKVPDETSLNIYANETGANASVAQIITLSASDVKSPGTIAMVLGGAQTVYASEKSLYVAGPGYSDGTTIHHFNLNSGAKYAGTTKVDGYLVGQFAMSEYNNVLRVATTKNDESAVYTLDATSPHLTQLGRITGLGKGERIFGVRFVGTRGFVVTSTYVIDPLFVMDLRDPQNPKLTGELTMPGFSTYLHSLDDTHLIGVGQDQGLKLSIYDVSKGVQPTEVQSVILGNEGSSSEALWNHHAFTFDANQKLLAIPVSVYAKTSQSGSNANQFQYNGLHLYRINPAQGFELLGIVKLDNVTKNGYEYATDLIHRSILINDDKQNTLLTIQNNALVLRKLDAQLSPLGSVSW